MAHVISSACISCGSCESECPVGAISQGDSQYEINPDVCVDCGACAGGCPVGASPLQEAGKSAIIKNIRKKDVGGPRQEPEPTGCTARRPGPGPETAPTDGKEPL